MNLREHKIDLKQPLLQEDAIDHHDRELEVNIMRRLQQEQDHKVTMLSSNEELDDLLIHRIDDARRILEEEMLGVFRNNAAAEKRSTSFKRGLRYFVGLSSFAAGSVLACMTYSYRDEIREPYTTILFILSFFI